MMITKILSVSRYTAWRNALVLLGLVVWLTACVEMGANAGRPSPQDAAAVARAKAHTELGAAYFQQNKLAVALEEFTEATQAYAGYALAYNGLGLVHAALGQDALAEVNFKRSLELDPSSSESHNNYGGFLCGRGRYDESIHEFLTALKNPLYTTPYLAYANAGICAARKKDLKTAEVYLNQALEIEPLTHSAAYQLAEIQFGRGETAKAHKTLQNTLLSNPGADALWLGVRIARALGDKDAEASYALELRRKYPNSPETKILLSGK